MPNSFFFTFSKAIMKITALFVAAALAFVAVQGAGSKLRTPTGYHDMVGPDFRNRENTAVRMWTPPLFRCHSREKDRKKKKGAEIKFKTTSCKRMLERESREWK